MRKAAGREAEQQKMKNRRKNGFRLITILYFIVVCCMCVTRFNLVMTLVGGPLTRIEAVNLVPFHSVRESLKYGRGPVSWDMLYNMAMFIPFGIIYSYYQRNFRIHKAIGMSCLTTFLIESMQFILKTGVVDIDDFIINTLGSLIGIALYCIVQKIAMKKPGWEEHEIIETIATMVPPMFVAFVAEMFLGDGTLKLLPVYNVLLFLYGVCVYLLLIKDFAPKGKIIYYACYVGAFYFSIAVL